MVREFKGVSTTAIFSDYTIIDIETTGLDPVYDEIIELSAIKVRNNAKYDTFSSLVRPLNKVSQSITDLTGITNDMLSLAPPLETILLPFFEFIENDIVVGHNIHFDINFLYDNSLRVLGRPFVNDFVDTLNLSRKTFPSISDYKLTTLADHFCLNKSPSHRALADCESTLELYNLIVKNICAPNKLMQSNSPNFIINIPANIGFPTTLEETAIRIKEISLNARLHYHDILAYRQFPNPYQRTPSDMTFYETRKKRIDFSMTTNELFSAGLITKLTSAKKILDLFTKEELLGLFPSSDGSVKKSWSKSKIIEFAIANYPEEIKNVIESSCVIDLPNELKAFESKIKNLLK